MQNQASAPGTLLEAHLGVTTCSACTGEARAAHIPMHALSDDRGGACVTLAKKSTNIVDVKSTVLVDLNCTCALRALISAVLQLAEEEEEEFYKHTCLVLLLDGVTPESSCRTVCLLYLSRRLSKRYPQRAVASSSSSCRGPNPPSIKVWTLLPVLLRFFTLLLLLLDQSCWLPAVAADVDRLLRLMSRRPASLQCSACYLETCCCILVLVLLSSQASAVIYGHL